VRADRLSCNRSISNHSRLLLPTAAYWLMDALRRKLVASEPGQRRDLRAEQGALVPRKKVPESVALQVKERQREVAWSGERQDTFPVPAEQLHKIIRDLDEVRRDLAGVEEVQNALMLRPRSARMAHSARVFSL
jgi:hypothetical protein